MNGTPRLFLSYSFGDETKNLVTIFRDVAKKLDIEVVTGEPPGPSRPQDLVRSRILSCDCFAAILTKKGKGRGNKPTGWIYNEIGMAYVLGMPLLVCKEKDITDLGIAGFEVSCQDFEVHDHAGFRSQLRGHLGQLKADPRLKGATTLGSFVSRLARDAINGLVPDAAAQSEAADAMVKILEPVIAESGLKLFSYGESDEFGEKRKKHLQQKKAIARYVVDKISKYSKHDDKWIFMDSGTVTYTICEEVVDRATRIPVMTNNLASCRIFSSIPSYPCLIVPGELESRYVAALGDECVDFLKRKLEPATRGPDASIEVAVVAATSLNSAYGICGNDPRHNEMKRTLLELCPHSMIVFEGEKLLEESGSPIFETKQNWQAFANKCKNKKKIEFITHRPEISMRRAQETLFDGTVDQLDNMFGRGSVTVLG